MANPYPDVLQMTVDTPAAFDNDLGDNFTVVGRVMRPGTVNSVEFIPNFSMSGAATNSRTLTLRNLGSAGAGTTAIATLALVSGVNLAAGVAKVITVTSANAAIAVGDSLRWESTHVGNGLPDPGGTVIVQQSLGT